MPSVLKTKRLTIRLSLTDLQAIKRAAQITQSKRGERVDESALVRQIAMPRIHAIIAEAAEVAA